jgi:hypothetical protein
VTSIRQIPPTAFRLWSHGAPFTPGITDRFPLVAIDDELCEDRLRTAWGCSMGHAVVYPHPRQPLSPLMAALQPPGVGGEPADWSGSVALEAMTRDVEFTGVAPGVMVVLAC